MKHFFSLFVIFVSISFCDVTNYKIGVLSFNNKELTLTKYEQTAKYLSNTVESSYFEIIPMDYEELDIAIQNQEIDFVFTNSGHYVIHEKNSNIFRIATIVKSEQDKFVSSFGGVMLALSSRDDIKNISDLDNKKIAAVGKESLGGYQAQIKEMIDLKVDVLEKNFIFSGLPQEKTLSLLFEEKVDVAFVRTGLIEELASRGKLDISRLKVINEKQTQRYPFKISTKLYPEWPFSSMPHIDSVTNQKVATALININAKDEAAMKGQYYGWTVPQDYGVVKELLQSLNLPPYDKKYDFTLSDILTKYNQLALLGLVLGFFFTIYLIFVTFRLYKTKKELEINQEKLQLSASVYVNSQNGV